MAPTPTGCSARSAEVCSRDSSFATLVVFTPGTRGESGSASLSWRRAVRYSHTQPYGLGIVPIRDIYHGGTASNADINTAVGFDRAYILDEMGTGIVTEETVGTGTIRNSRCRY